MNDKPTNAEIQERHESDELYFASDKHDHPQSVQARKDRGILLDRLKEETENLLLTHIAWLKEMKRAEAAEEKLREIGEYANTCAILREIPTTLGIKAILDKDNA